MKGVGGECCNFDIEKADLNRRKITKKDLKRFGIDIVNSALWLWKFTKEMEIESECSGSSILNIR